MSEEKEFEPQIVEIYNEDGETTKCEVYDIFDFEGKTYVTLIPYEDGNEDAEDPEAILMQFIEEGDEGYFQNIDDEEEFQRVCEYVQSLEDEDEDEGEE